MPKKKATKEGKDGGVLVTAATTIGRAAGRIAALVHGGMRPSKKAKGAPTKKAEKKKVQAKKAGMPRKAAKAAKPSARKRS